MKDSDLKKAIKGKMIAAEPRCFDLLINIFSPEEIMKNTPQSLRHLISIKLEMDAEHIRLRNLQQWRRRFIGKQHKKNTAAIMQKKGTSDEAFNINDFVPTRYEDVAREEKPLIIPVYRTS